METDPSTVVAEPGGVVWACSDEDGGPDVGIWLGLGGGKVLYVGEITEDVYNQGRPDVVEVGDSGGWWMTLDGIPLAKFACRYAAADFIETLSAKLRLSAPPQRLPAEAFHPAEFILEEMRARGWKLDDVAIRMGGDEDMNALTLGLYLTVRLPGMRLGDKTAAALGCAFDVDAQYFLNLEAAWLAAQEPSHAR